MAKQPRQAERSRKSGDGRQLALAVLRRVRRDAAYANLALSGTIDRQRAQIAPRERALATELVYGVLRNQRRLDAVIGKHSSRPLARVDAEVLDILRIATYQLLLLDRVPDHAAVNEAVEEARRIRGKALAGFVNAVLRRIEPADWEAVIAVDRPRKALGLELSLPVTLVSLWCDELGFEQTRQLGACLLERAPLTARCNRARCDPAELRRRLEAEGATVDTGRWAPDALLISGHADLFRSRSYLDGLWTAQDEAAQLVAELVAPAPGERILDGCAGVGGKATHLAAKLGEDGEVVASDVNERKLQLLADHCRRLGVRCTTRRQDLAAGGGEQGPAFDRVLVDAPCSGLGVLRRHPELKWRSELAEAASWRATIDGLVALQRALLRGAVGRLRPGGLLVYAVCTTSKAEGPEQARWLLESQSDLEPAPPSDGVLGELFAGGIELMLWPHRHGTDGFYMTRLRKADK